MPEIRARALDELTRTIEQIGGALAVRAGREPDDFAARVMAGALIGVIMAATIPWAADNDLDVREMFARIDAGLAQLENGLVL